MHCRRPRTELLVDVVVPGWVPFRSFTVATDVAGLLQAHDQLLEYATDNNVDTVVSAVSPGRRHAAPRRQPGRSHSSVVTSFASRERSFVLWSLIGDIAFDETVGNRHGAGGGGQ